MKRRTTTYNNAPYKRPRLVRQDAMPSLAALDPKAAEIKKLQTKVRRLEKRPEVKSTYNTYNATPSVVGTLANATLAFSSVPVGTDDDSRIGNQIIAKHLRVRVHLTPSTSSRTYRILIFSDKAHSGSSVLAASNLHGNNFSVLEDGGAMVPVYVMNHKSETRHRYKIYRDIVFTISPNQDNVNANVQVFDIPLNLKVEYVDTFTANTSVQKNMLQISVSEQTATTGTPISIQGELEFIDP